MQTDIKNKALAPDAAKAKEQYFFPGGMEYEPMTVTASDQEEANKIYESQKVKTIKSTN